MLVVKIALDDDPPVLLKTQTVISIISKAKRRGHDYQLVLLRRGRLGTDFERNFPAECAAARVNEIPSVFCRQKVASLWRPLPLLSGSLETIESVI